MMTCWSTLSVSSQLKRFYYTVTSQARLTLSYSQYDGETLVCEYSDGADVYSEDIKANIYLLDLPNSPVLVADLVEGQPASLSLTAGLYPSPEKILWTVKDLEGAVQTVMPGEEEGRYRAAVLQMEVRHWLIVGQHYYFYLSAWQGGLLQTHPQHFSAGPGGNS